MKPFRRSPCRPPDRGALMLRRIARFSYRRRRRVLVTWIIALVGLSALGGAVGSSFARNFTAPGTESQRATDLLKARFPARAGDEGQIVFTDKAGVRVAAVQERMTAVFDAVSQVHGVTVVDSPYASAGGQQASRDGTVAYAAVEFAKRDNQITAATKDAIEAVVDRARGNGLVIELGGRMFEPQPGLGAAELIGVGAAIVILLVVFGSVLA